MDLSLALEYVKDKRRMEIIFTKVTGRMIRKMDRACINIPTEIFMREIGGIIKKMGKEYIPSNQARVYRDVGEKIS